MEALWLFKDWERFQLRGCDYRNHRIFTLKCISKVLVPVRIRLKTTIKTEKARKIIRKAEKDLLQARFKSINSILGDSAKQRELSMSQLVSIVSTSTMDKCQWFVHKVSELTFLKIKERQINNFSRLLLKKEGNITQFTSRANPQAGSTSTVPPQAGGSQAESTGSQAATTSPPQAGSSWAENTDAQAASTSSQAVSTIPQGDSAASPWAGSCQEASTSPQAANPNSQWDSTVPSQAGSSQAENTDSQAVNTSPQVTSTNSQRDSTVQAGSPQADNADSQAVSTISSGSQHYLPGR